MGTLCGEIALVLEQFRPMLTSIFFEQADVQSVSSRKSPRGFVIINSRENFLFVREHEVANLDGAFFANNESFDVMLGKSLANVNFNLVQIKLNYYKINNYFGRRTTIQLK